ncbi:DUF6056 family protein [Galactobacillus timonensis]|uniref:DUF6056 family protein n=2 Tax=Galactobacillus timonensis TaxID=2041840 RepID=UPI003219101E
MRDSDFKFAFRLFFSCLLGSLVPLIVISFYDHPILDDFSYGAPTRHTWIATHSFWDVLKTASENVKSTYLSWSGSYTNVFLNSIHGGVFSEKWYPFCPLIVIFLFLLGTWILMKEVLEKQLRASRSRTLFVYLVVVVLSLNLMISPVAGIYWWTSAQYYTGFYSCALIFLARILALRRIHNGRIPVLHLVVLCVCGFLLMGGNLLTILSLLLVMTCFIFFSLLDSKKGTGELLVLEAVLLFGFLLNVLSPGVALRKSGTVGFPVFQTILQSIWSAIKSFAFNSTPVILLSLIPVVLALWNRMKSAELCADPRLQILFRYRIPVTIFSFGIYAAQWAPSWYAIGTEGEFRAQNLCFFSYFWLLLFWMIIWFGWFHSSHPAAETKPAGFILTKRRRILYILLLGCSLALYRSLDRIAGISAWKSLLTGEAQRYSEERFEQDHIFSTSTGDVTVKAVDAEPNLLRVYGFLLSEDPDTWTNTVEAEYYGLNSISALQ